MDANWRVDCVGDVSGVRGESEVDEIGVTCVLSDYVCDVVLFAEIVEVVAYGGVLLGEWWSHRL